MEMSSYVDFSCKITLFPQKHHFIIHKSGNYMRRKQHFAQKNAIFRI